MLENLTAALLILALAAVMVWLVFMNCRLRDEVERMRHVVRVARRYGGPLLEQRLREAEGAES